jgi:hypothetical protein
MAAHELRNLARLCGVTMEFRDNFGKRRRPSRATMEALLTAMGVPCGTPAEIRDSLEHCLSLLADRLLPPFTVATPDTGHCLLLHLKWPRAEIPSGVDLAGEFTAPVAAPCQPPQPRVSPTSHGWQSPPAFPAAPP